MKQNKRKSIIIIMSLLILLMVIGIVGYFLAQTRTMGKTDQKAAEADSTADDTDSDEDEEDWSDGDEIALFFGDDYYSTSDDIKTYLFTGTDLSGSGIEAEDSADYEGSMADFLLLAVENKTQSTYGFLQIDRNTITDVDVLDDKNESDGAATEQICCAHWYGTNQEAGCQNTVAAVEYLLGYLEIDGYYCMNMEDIAQLNQLVGGVEVTLEDDFTEVDPDMKVGETLTLDDQQAFHYIHDRINIADGTNANRMKRQKTYLQAFLQKAKERIKEDPNSLNDMIEGMEEIGQTDISGRDISKLVNEMYQSDSMGILSFRGQTKEGNVLDDGEVHEEFYPEEDSIIEVMCQLMNLQKDTDE